MTFVLAMSKNMYAFFCNKHSSIKFLLKLTVVQIHPILHPYIDFFTPMYRFLSLNILLNLLLILNKFCSDRYETFCIHNIICIPMNLLIIL